MSHNAPDHDESVINYQNGRMRLFLFKIAISGIGATYALWALLS